jgi:ribosomal protein L29
MKKHAHIATLSHEELTEKIAVVRTEVIELARGTRLGDVQNVRASRLKRKELARMLTAHKTAQPKAETAPKKTTKKETK